MNDSKDVVGSICRKSSNIFIFEETKPIWVDSTTWSEITSCIEEDLIPENIAKNILQQQHYLTELQQLLSIERFLKSSTLTFHSKFAHIYKAIQELYNFFKTKEKPVEDNVFIKAIYEFITQKLHFNKVLLDYFGSLECRLEEHNKQLFNKIETLICNRIKLDASLIWQHVGAFLDLNILHLHSALQIANLLPQREINNFYSLHKDNFSKFLDHRLLLKIFIINDVKQYAKDKEYIAPTEFENEVLKRTTEIYEAYKVYEAKNTNYIYSNDDVETITPERLKPLYNLNYFEQVKDTVLPEVVLFLNKDILNKKLVFTKQINLIKWNKVLSYIIETTNYDYIFRLSPEEVPRLVNIESNELRNMLATDKAVNFNIQASDKCKPIILHHSYIEPIQTSITTVGVDQNLNEFSLLD
ncbi:MAG: hypothetical protein K0Q51_683 [Rickettsiaceae bacterium]|nr:hypothetical protein [Rickettsiaceae bacterium]